MMAVTIYDYGNIPEGLHEGLNAYVLSGRPTGDCLRAVLSNDLVGAFDRADVHTTLGMPALVSWLRNVAPAACWGSPDAYGEWVELGGLLGMLGDTDKTREFWKERAL